MRVLIGADLICKFEQVTELVHPLQQTVFIKGVKREMADGYISADGYIGCPYSEGSEPAGLWLPEEWGSEQKV